MPQTPSAPQRSSPSPPAAADLEPVRRRLQAIHADVRRLLPPEDEPEDADTDVILMLCRSVGALSEAVARIEESSCRTERLLHELLDAWRRSPAGAAGPTVVPFSGKPPGA